MVKLRPLKALAAAARMIFALAVRRPVTVSPIKAELRVQKCYRCPSYDWDSGQCRECSCFVSIKTLLTTESCPKGKW